MIALRSLEINDKQYLVKALNDHSVIQYLSSNIPAPYTIDDAQWFIETGSKDNALVKAITYQEAFCGVIGVYFRQKEYAHSAEIGYWLLPECWQKGIATQAVSQFCDLVFNTTSVCRIFNPVSAPNLASIRVMEKAGFSLEGIHKMAVQHDDTFIDELLYAKVKLR